jgi:hypothetical protein
MIHTVFFITVRTVMTLLTYCNEENRTNRVVMTMFRLSTVFVLRVFHEKSDYRKSG